MAKKNNGASNALVQGSILAVASIISRIIGLIYRIPMQRILGDIGIGYYSTAFEIYNVMLIISIIQLTTCRIKDGFSPDGKKEADCDVSDTEVCSAFCNHQWYNGGTHTVFWWQFFCNNAS